MICFAFGKEFDLTGKKDKKILINIYLNIY